MHHTGGPIDRAGADPAQSRYCRRPCANRPLTAEPAHPVRKGVFHPQRVIAAFVTGSSRLVRCTGDVQRPGRGPASNPLPQVQIGGRKPPTADSCDGHLLTRWLRGTMVAGHATDNSNTAHRHGLWGFWTVCCGLPRSPCDYPLSFATILWSPFAKDRSDRCLKRGATGTQAGRG
jgi:hypothetical protein